jgi:hypothetical protein
VGRGQLRFEDWPRRLDELIARNLTRPCVYGTHDCCLWAAADVEALTGRDPGAEYRGTYASPLAAARLLKSLGGLDALADRWLPRLPSPRLAQRGDVVAIQSESGPALAVNIGARIAAVSAEGLTFLPAAAALNAWRV